jgi:hypothetical protein
MTTPARKPEVVRSNFKFCYGILLPRNPKKSDMRRAAALFQAIGATMCASLCKKAEKWLEV